MGKANLILKFKTPKYSHAGYWHLKWDTGFPAASVRLASKGALSAFLENRTEILPAAEPANGNTHDTCCSLNVEGTSTAHVEGES